jgi:hypothetical protein
MLIIGVGFLLLGTLFSVIFARGALTDLHISTFGVAGTGVVTEIGVETSMEINGKHPYRVAFAYDDHGHREGASFSTNEGRMLKMVVGSAQPIQYVAGSPGTARIAGTEKAPFGLMGLMTLVFPVVGAGLALHAVRMNRRQANAYRFGRATRGLVTARGEDTSVSSNDRHPMRIAWMFDVDGVQHRGELTHFDHGLLLGAFPDDEVIVLYDPRSPGTSNTLFIPDHR